MDVEEATSREYFLEFIFLQLIHTGAAGNDDGLDIEVVKRVRHAMEQHAIVSDDFLALISIAGSRLRITAAKISGWQNGLHAEVIKHRLRRQPDLTKQPLRTAPGEIEHGFGIYAPLACVADDRYHLVVLYIKQCTRGFLWQAARHRLVDKVDNLRLDCRRAHRGGWSPGLHLGQQEFFCQRMCKPLNFISPVDHQSLDDLDRGRIGSVEIKHRGSGAGIEFLFAFFTQQISHRNRDIAKIDINRARAFAFVAYRAMVCDIGKFIEVAQ